MKKYTKEQAVAARHLAISFMAYNHAHKAVFGQRDTTREAVTNLEDWAMFLIKDQEKTGVVMRSAEDIQRALEIARYSLERSERPGVAAAVYAEETGVDYATALVHCNMD
jgi:predicted RNase H-like HicB family nuclease